MGNDDTMTLSQQIGQVLITWGLLFSLVFALGIWYYFFENQQAQAYIAENNCYVVRVQEGARERLFNVGTPGDLLTYYCPGTGRSIMR